MPTPVVSNRGTYYIFGIVHCINRQSVTPNAPTQTFLRQVLEVFPCAHEKFTIHEHRSSIFAFLELGGDDSCLDAEVDWQEHCIDRVDWDMLLEPSDMTAADVPCQDYPISSDKWNIDVGCCVSFAP